MRYLYSRTAWSAAIFMVFIGEASVAGTWVCSDPQGNEVYTDRNGPRCREFLPTNPDDSPKKPSAKTPQPLKRRSAEGDHKEASYSEQDLLRAVASGNKGKAELVLRAGISANAKDEQGQSALTVAAAL